jgi:hypothetical protein
MARKPIKQYATLTDDSGADALSVATGGAVTARTNTTHTIGNTTTNASATLSVIPHSTKQAVLALSPGDSGGLYIRARGDDSGNISFDDNSSNYKFGQITTAGAWTLGPSSGGTTGVHTIRGAAGAGSELLLLNKTAVSAGTASYFIGFAQSGTAEGYIWHDTGGSLAFQNASDARLKENIREITGLDKILALHPVMFDWKTKEAKDCVGFIAQEVETVLPRCVSVGPDGNTKLLSIANELLPLLTKSIQEQQAIIEDLKTRLAALEAKP